MLETILAKTFGTKHEREVKAMRPLVAAISDLEPRMKELSDQELAAQTVAFREQLAEGAPLDDLLIPAFATVREAGRRFVNMRHFDVQLIGGVVLHRGKIAEMKTGEGKTLVATLPVYLNALEGKGVHVVTVNDYLAKRDSDWMGRIYRFLGLTVGVIQHHLSDEERQIAYRADITYGTNNELGFDYLRDNMKFDLGSYVQHGQVIIVDEFTGRLMPGRRWSDGLHQAVEAKEKVKIERENQTLATITFQNYFRMYKKLAGMTGTAETEAAEFDKIYKLEVLAIPTNRPLIRVENPDVVYRTETEKFDAVVAEIKDLHDTRRPRLVGTICIEKSEHLSTLLKKAGIKHVVLNAKYHEREAEIVAQAGRYGAVTIATNMAGRGTDIILGGVPDYRLRAILIEKEIDPEQATAEQRQEGTDQAIAEMAVEEPPAGT